MYIEREALRRAIFDAEWLNSQDEDVAYDVLESVAAADVVKRERGEWLARSEMVRMPFYKNYDCSVCGENNICTNFCPHCGADMRGETDG